jgi:hypothetical protein
MWIWASEFYRLGFRRRSDRYWRCEGRFSLQPNQHLSVFPWSELSQRRGRNQDGPRLVQLDVFHVTFAIAGEHLHFYYHELAENVWRPGGHTSCNELIRLGLDPEALRRQADAIAAKLVQALGGCWRPRSRDGPALSTNEGRSKLCRVAAAT